jgi:hypothetical protein
MLGAGGVPCRAQNLPPPGAYQPIPNFTGVGAGLQFREAINDRFSGAQPIAPSIASTAFANLPPEQDGMLLFCNNCRSATPCASGGSGAFAFGQGGLWSCAGTASALLTALTQNLATAGHSINGSTSAGADQINNISVNGMLNATSYGAVCSSTTASATTTSGNSTVTVGAIGDFQVGQYVKLAHAGAANALATPTLTSAGPFTYNLNPAPRPVTHGGVATDWSGCIADTSASPFHNASCTTSYTYEIQNVAGNGSWSAPSTPVTMSNGAAVLSTDNYNQEVWTNDPSAIGTVLCGCHGASCTPTAMLAVLPVLPVGETSAHTQHWDDMGNHFGSDETFGTSCSTTAQPADLLTQITAINGTVITLATAPAQSGTVLMTHDDEPAFAAALVAAQPVGQQPVAKIELPYCAAGYPMAQPLSFYGTSGIAFGGQSRAAYNNANVNLIWEGPTGGIMFNMDGASSFTISDLAVFGSPGNTPGLVYSNDNYTGPGPGGNPAGRSEQALTNGRYEHDSVSQVGIGWTLDTNGSIGNVEDMEWDDFACVDLPTGKGGFACFVGGSNQTDNERFNGGLIGNRDYGWQGGFGHLLIRNVDMGATMIGVAGGGYNNCIFDWEGGQPDAAIVVTNDLCITRLAGLNYEANQGPSGYAAYFTNGVANLMENNSWGGNIAINNGSGTFTSIGNLFNPLVQPWYGSYPATAFSAPFTDNGGGQSTPVYTEINDTINGVGKTGLVSTVPNTIPANLTLVKNGGAVCVPPGSGAWFVSGTGSCPTAAPTPTPTATPTASPTGTSTPTRTPTATPT